MTFPLQREAIPGTEVTLELPIRLVSLANLREHRRKTARRAAEHRGVTRLALRGPLATWRMWLSPAWPLEVECAVRLTRIAPVPFDDDNLVAAFKNVRDGVADALGLTSDRDPRVKWQYAQERRGVRIYGVEFIIGEKGESRQ